jgi:DNA-binding transcriptional regulator YiaG
MAALPAEPTAADVLEEAAAVIRRVAQGLREDRRRRQAAASPNGGVFRRAHPPQGVTGAQVREARRRLRLSQRQLGEELHVSRGMIADAEAGRRGCPPVVASWAKRILKGGG